MKNNKKLESLIIQHTFGSVQIDLFCSFSGKTGHLTRSIRISKNHNDVEDLIEEGYIPTFKHPKKPVNYFVLEVSSKKDQKLFEVIAVAKTAKGYGGYPRVLTGHQVKSLWSQSELLL